LFTVVESRSADPLMPSRMFHNRSLAAALAITFTFMGTFGTLPYFLTVVFQSVHGFSALRTGLAFLVPSVSIFVGTQIGERMATKITTKVTLLAGFAVGAVGTVVLAAAVSADGSYASLIPGLAVMGVGQGIAWTGRWIAASAGVVPEEQGVASGMASTTQQIGYAVGLAVLVAIANAGIHGRTGDPLRVAIANGTKTAAYVNGAALLLGVVFALMLPRKSSADKRSAAPACRTTATPANSSCTAKPSSETKLPH
jgi:predicted MFS family arabinose efflux permease